MACPERSPQKGKACWCLLGSLRLSPVLLQQDAGPPELNWGWGEM